MRDVRLLAEHLLSPENETVEVMEVSGTMPPNLHEAIAEMKTLSLGTRTRRALYHASMNLSPSEADSMTEERWREAADALERKLGMEGHQRALVKHVKLTEDGRPREHLHIVWNRVHPTTLKTTTDSNNYRHHEECARELEAHWNLHPVTGAFTRPDGTPRPVAQATHKDWQASTRTGIRVGDVATALKEAWAVSDNGRAFMAEAARQGLFLARGRRGVIAVDRAGTPHSLPRRLGWKAHDVRRRLVDLNPSELPTVEQLKLRLHGKGGTDMQDMEHVNNVAPTGQADGRPTDWESLKAYWQSLGFDPEDRNGTLWIQAYGGWLRDHGDRLEIYGDATDEQIKALVSAAKARGWEGIRFWGDADFQRRARLEAIRQGYDPKDITLACEDKIGDADPLPPQPMPDHLRERLSLTDGDDEPNGPESDPSADVDRHRMPTA